jgi:type VI secretion system protein ImpH
MAGTSGQGPDHIIRQLAEQPFDFDFFRAVRLVESQHAQSPRIGRSISPVQEPIRFAQSPSLAFAPSTIEKLQWPEGSAVPRLFIRFFGLFGPNGPLPPHLTEYALERQLHFNDHTFAAFLNVFHHRLLEFFYRAWADSQKAVDMDRADSQGFVDYIGSFFGLGMESLRERDSVQDAAKLFFAGRLASQTRNAEGLEAILEAYFEIKTEVQTFVGRWLDLPADSLCRLGESPETGRMGMTAIVGSHTWACQLGFRIRAGPMKLKDYERLLPHGKAFRRLKYWVLNYLGEQFFWDIQLVLEADEVPDTCLGKSGRLGWTTWMKTAPMTRDADDLILNPPPE